jgi:hypothetical protein
MFKKPDLTNHLDPHWRARLFLLAVLTFTGVLVVATDSALGQQSQAPPRRSAARVRFDTGRRSATVPFDFADDALVVRVRVNNSPPLKFFFDTGAGISVVSTAQAAKLGLKSAAGLDVVGTGGTVSGGMAKGVSLSVPGVTVLNQTVAVFALDDFPCEARDIAGIIGYDFIKEFVVEIDYEAKTIRLLNPRNYSDSGRGTSFPLTILKTPRVRAQIRIPDRPPIEGLFEIDTGHEGTLVINSPFVKRHHLLESLGKQIPTNGRGVGGVSMRISARLQSLQLGPYTVPAPVVGLSLQTAGALSTTDNDGPLGNEILQRFRVRLDYSRHRMWLEPNAHLADQFQNDTSGIEFDSAGDDCRIFKVTSIAESSPAAEAGIQPGDEIVAIDDRAVAQFSSSEIYQLFMVEGAQHQLTIRRANQNLVVTIKLRRLL